MREMRGNMAAHYGPTWAEINLDAIAENVRHIKAFIGDSTELIAVVKANAYGHGAAPVARTALEAGATRLAVARTVEGLALRQAGIKAPILVMGYAPPEEVPLLARWSLTPTLITLEQARLLSQEGLKLGPKHPVHIKVDTGMGRFGLLPDEVLDFVKAVARLPGLELEGLYTHFSVADEVSESSTSYTREQFQTFMNVAADLEEAGFHFPLTHLCNSAATMRFPDMHLDGVRVGIALYGLPPSEETPLPFPLRPALTLKSLVARVRTLPTASSISYGRTYTTSRPTPVALVPLGYGGGYHRLISNRGQVLIRGKRAPIVGRVCMDQFVVDVTGIEGASQDDEVVLIGCGGDDRISAGEVARWAETINYEVTTSLLPRVSRVYIRNGEVVELKALVDLAGSG
jgi:alanine racemase